ncbi:hypothetical protein [Chitinibacter sp. S2-10]|uniref:hypothetical protein n=1 Tax=Chitinibacter sp. S2-10 TaxID=3373597 RepID=UPI003977C320
MKGGFYKIYCIAVITICTLFNLSSCSFQSSGSRSWSSGSSSGGWSSGGGHK